MKKLKCSEEEKQQANRTEGGRSSQSNQKNGICKVTEKTGMNHAEDREMPSVEHAALREGVGFAERGFVFPLN